MAHFGVFAEDMRDETVKDLGVLRDTRGRAMGSNQIDPHL
jgi:hypothetical protein